MINIEIDEKAKDYIKGKQVETITIKLERFGGG
jgi:hypothetical protein